MNSCRRLRASTASFLAVVLCVCMSAAPRAKASTDLEGTVSAEDMSAVITQAADRFDAMSDEEVGQVLESEADALRSARDEAVGENIVTDSSPTALAADEIAAQTTDTAQRPGARKRIVGALRRMAKLTAMGVGYAGEAYTLAFVSPLLLGVGFGLGVVTGRLLPSTGSANQLGQWGLVAGAFGAFVGESQLVLLAPVPLAAGLLPGFGILAANMIVCNHGNGKTPGYCRNLSRLADGMISGAAKTGQKGGSRVHRLLPRIFHPRHHD